MKKGPSSCADDPNCVYGLPVLRFLCLTPGLNELCRCCVRIGRAADCGDDEEPLDARGLEGRQICCLHAAANHDGPRADLVQGTQVVEILRDDAAVGGESGVFFGRRLMQGDRKSVV